MVSWVIFLVQFSFEFIVSLKIPFSVLYLKAIFYLPLETRQLYNKGYLTFCYHHNCCTIKAI